MSGNQGDTPVVWSAFTGRGGQQVFLNDGSSQVTGAPNGRLGVNDDRGSGVPEPATVRTLRAALALIALVA